VVFAAQTARGASSAIEALKLGAIEVVSKPDGTNASFDDALKHVKRSASPRFSKKYSHKGSPDNPGTSK
jgi:chemotaxis response regulator CheB